MAYYEILRKKVVDDTIHKLVKTKLPNVSRETRRRLLEDIMEKEDAFGMIEWWSRGSIINKPREECFIILLCLRD